MSLPTWRQDFRCCRVLSAKHCEKTFDFIGTVALHREGLVVLADDMTALTVWKQDEVKDLNVELTPGPEMHEAIVASRRLGLPPVATTRASFLRPADYYAHRLLRAIAETPRFLGFVLSNAVLRCIG